MASRPQESPNPKTSTARNSAGSLRHLLVLTAILLAAAWLRAPGLFWGYGLLGHHDAFVYLHPDEPRFVEIARGLDTNQPFRRSYVLGYGQWLRMIVAVARKTGHRISDPELIMAARLTSFVSGLILVGLTFVFARMLQLPPGVSLVAAGLVAGNTLCVIHSHYGTADMTYVALLYGFLTVTLASVRSPSAGRITVAAALAGIAMAVKFGLIVLPSLACLPWVAPRRRGWWSLSVAAVALIAFLGAQGFSFNLASLCAITQSARLENLGGIRHPRWANPLVYLVESVRALSLPVAAGVVLGLCRPIPARARLGPKAWLVGLPLVLHLVGLQGLVLPFPRHLLALMPAFAILSAWGYHRCRGAGRALAACALLWSGGLAWSDDAAYRRDSRGAALEWLAAHVPQDRTVWADPYFRRLPVHMFYPPASPGEADVILRHEGWFYRFRRSELSPFGPPGPDALYHATQDDLEIERMLDSGLKKGTWQYVFEAGPPAWLPEQWAYRWLWGNFDKFAGRSLVLMRQQKAGGAA